MAEPHEQAAAETQSVMTLLGPLARHVRHTSLTKVQRRAIPFLFEHDDNVLVAAPTGSGKTLLLEVAMLRLFRDRLLQPPSSTPAAGSVKAVYVCPIKALAAEKYAAWSTMFAPLTVAIETGDQEKLYNNEMNLQAVTTADIIVTTPERWDSITRRWKERTVLGLVNSVGLLLLDEIHTVSEERGAVLEALVSRTKAIKSAGTYATATTATTSADPASSHRVRLVAISGTLPNIHDVGEWLEVPVAMRLSFSDADRPVPLSIRAISFSSDSRNPFIFDRFLTFKLFGLLREYGEGKPAIVFCASRKETVTAAQQIVSEIQQAAARSGLASQLEPSTELTRRVQGVNDKALKTCLLVGVAFHHAALSLHDRQMVEQLFREQFISAVCTTTTLALGVNLPAHLVVVKGTTFFKNGTRDDIPLSEVAQMCGRAGRPGLDSHGVALILTTDNKVAKYDQLRTGDAFTTTESRLHQNMIEHVNAEVALRTIHSFDSAVSWVKTTFFWIRLRRNPVQYGLQFTTRQDRDSFDADAFVAALVRRVLEALQAEDCVAGLPPAECRLTPDGDPLARLETTGVGRAMSRLYILFDTVKVYNACLRQHRRPNGGALGDADDQDDDEAAVIAEAGTVTQPDTPRQRQTTLTGTATAFSFSQVLTLLAHSHEFLDVRLRQGDRGHLNALNKAVKYPLKSGKKGGREVREDWQKAFVLIQVPLSQLTLTDGSLRNDSIRLWSAVPRVVRFLCEYSWLSLSYSLALHADLLRRCVDKKVWPDGLLLRQLPTVTEPVARALAKAGLRQLRSLDDVDARRLEVLCGRLPPFGNQLRALAMALPRPVLSIQATPQGRGRGDGRLPPAATYRLVVDMTAACGAPPGDLAVFSAATASVTAKRKDSDAEHHDHRPILLLVGHAATDAILLKRYIPVANSRDAQPTTTTFELALPRTLAAHTVTVHMIAPDLVGDDVARPLEDAVNEVSVTAPSIEPAKKPTPTAVSRRQTQTALRKRARSTSAEAAGRSLDADDALPAATMRGESGKTGRVGARAEEAGAEPPAAAETTTDTDVAQEAREAYEALLSDLQYVADPAPAARGARCRQRAKMSAPQAPVAPAASTESPHQALPKAPSPPAATPRSPARPMGDGASPTGYTVQPWGPASARGGWVCAALPPPPRLDPMAPAWTRHAPVAASPATAPALLHGPCMPDTRVSQRFQFGVAATGAPAGRPSAAAYRSAEAAPQAARFPPQWLADAPRTAPVPPHGMPSMHHRASQDPAELWWASCASSRASFSAPYDYPPASVPVPAGFRGDAYRSNLPRGPYPQHPAPVQSYPHRYPTVAPPPAPWYDARPLQRVQASTNGGQPPPSYDAPPPVPPHQFNPTPAFALPPPPVDNPLPRSPGRYRSDSTGPAHHSAHRATIPKSWW